MYVLLSAISLLVFVVALVDIIIRPQDQVKHLPKFLWIVIVIILPFIGSVIWFAVGREYTASNTPKAFTRRSAPGAPGSPRAQAQRSNPWPEPKTTEQELAELDREIEFYNKQAELKRLKSEAEGQPKAGE